MAKILLINGSPNQFGCTYTALSELATTLEVNGVTAEIFWLGKAPIADCMACKGCHKTGRCVINDGVNTIAARLDEFEGIVVGSPVYYGSAAGSVCSFLDRLFYSAGSKMRGKLAASVVSCRRGGATAAFQRLNMYFGISNMVVVGSQYWNQVHGRKADDVKEDAEGLQTMRTLATNMAWLAKSIDAGRKSGLPAPEYEHTEATDFIR